MIVICGIDKIKRFKSPVVALGVFDGVHRAHQKIINSTVQTARSIGGTSIVLTFWPHPQKEKSLYSLKHRLKILKELCLDVCVVVDFNLKFAKVSAEGFVKDILVDKLSAEYLYVGRDFRFGKGASGSLVLLKKLGRRFGFKVKGFNMLKYKRLPISSTLIRKMITVGDIEGAAKLLGRPVSVLGRVVKGASLGKKIGFPTANIKPHHEVIPPCGIYAAKVILGKKILKGACYIGKKPTIKEAKKRIGVEAHILNYKGDLYNKDVEVQFIKRIRPDKKFSSLDFLSAQIKKDLLKIKKIFSSL
ncbi:MAG: bifunctional riboflavin kinase/FAD synthetase [Candidatus Omnitrophota bacterium]